MTNHTALNQAIQSKLDKFGSIMIKKPHMAEHQCHGIFCHRKPRIKNGKWYVTYNRTEYEIVKGEIFCTATNSITFYTKWS